MTQTDSFFAPDDLRQLATEVFVRQDMPAADAARVAEDLIAADLRGLGSHGIARLPIYAERLRRGLVKPRPKVRVDRVTPAVALVDGDNGMGFIIGHRAMDEAMVMAGEVGIGLVGAHRSTHYGMAALYALQAIEAGYIGLTLTNSSPAHPVWGGRNAFLGASPLAVAAPAGLQVPYVLDMAMTVIARGKIRLAALRGDSIPEGLALDGQGRPTTDARTAYEDGVCLPFGGAKGAALSMMMEVLCGVLTGAAFGGEVKSPYKDFSGPQNVGHLFIALRSDLFISRQAFLDRMDTLVERVKACSTAEGFDEILFPGEPELRAEAALKRTGIPVGREVLAALTKEAGRSGLAMPLPRTSPEASTV